MKGLFALFIVLFAAVLTCSWWGAAVFPCYLGPNQIALLWIIAAILTVAAVLIFVIATVCCFDDGNTSIIIVKSVLVFVLTAVYTSLWWIAALFEWQSDTGFEPAWWIAGIITFIAIIFCYEWLHEHWDDR